MGEVGGSSRGGQPCHAPTLIGQFRLGFKEEQERTRGKCLARLIPPPPGLGSRPRGLAGITPAGDLSRSAPYTAFG